MLKKLLSFILIGAALLSFNVFQPVVAQTLNAPANAERSTLDKQEFLRKIKQNVAAEQSNDASVLEKDLLKTHVQKQNKLSSGAKTGLIVGIVAAAIVGVILAVTLGNNDNNVSQCGSGVTTPCPPGCVCAN